MIPKPKPTEDEVYFRTVLKAKYRPECANRSCEGCREFFCGLCASCDEPLTLEDITRPDYHHCKACWQKHKTVLSENAKRFWRQFANDPDNPYKDLVKP
jgi:hypothetical protein